ncbi:hypothetical protein, partial [Pseudomonas aeruginosa]|uniref:hypothetical protein n=1 Tax=Pseudomonas aeruginosa TaxID=287 RepID=UPI002B4141B7
LTCNVHYQQLHAAELRRLIDETRPDIIALQYWSSKHEAELFPPGAWQTQRRDGQFYLASHYALRSARPIDDPVCAVRYELDALNGRLRF